MTTALEYDEDFLKIVDQMMELINEVKDSIKGQSYDDAAYKAGQISGAFKTLETALWEAARG